MTPGGTRRGKGGKTLSIEGGGRRREPLSVAVAPHHRRIGVLVARVPSANEESWAFRGRLHLARQPQRSLSSDRRWSCRTGGPLLGGRAHRARGLAQSRRGEADSPENKPTSSTSPLFWHQEGPRASRPEVLTIRAPRPTPLDVVGLPCATGCRLMPRFATFSRRVHRPIHGTFTVFPEERRHRDVRKQGPGASPTAPTTSPGC